MLGDSSRSLYVRPRNRGRDHDEIGGALVGNVSDRAKHADVALSAEEMVVVKAWFGAAT